MNRDYRQYDYVDLYVCNIASQPDAVCRYFTETVVIEKKSNLFIQGTHTAAWSTGSSYVYISINGIVCSVDRSIAGSDGYTPHSSASCVYQLYPGTYNIYTQFVGDTGASVARAFGSRLIF